MTADDDHGAGLPRAFAVLWQDEARGEVKPPRTRGLDRERVVTAAVELADAEGLAAVSMARLAERLGCGTMSLYRHVANKDELVAFMLARAPGAPTPPRPNVNWRDAVADWAHGLWAVYHRHPWVLQASAAGPPADPGQVAWLEAGLAALSDTDLDETEKLSAVLAVLHFVRGAAALHLEAAGGRLTGYPAMLRPVLDPHRFPALTAALAAGVFDGDDDALAGFDTGLRWLLDGIDARVADAGR
jgi:AcrR family transcriptional regulator